jgi:hypothetical protein
MDQLTALKPDSLDDVQKVLFFLKMPTYIWHCGQPVGLPGYLMECSNEVWEHHNIDGGLPLCPRWPYSAMMISPPL